MRGRDCGDVGVVGRWVSRSFVGSAFMGVGGVASGRGKAGIAIQTMKKTFLSRKKRCKGGNIDIVIKNRRRKEGG